MYVSKGIIYAGLLLKRKYQTQPHWSTLKIYSAVMLSMFWANLSKMDIKEFNLEQSYLNYLTTIIMESLYVNFLKNNMQQALIKHF